MRIRFALPETEPERNKVIRFVTDGITGLAAAGLTATMIFTTFEVAPFWAGFWTGIICIVSTLYVAGFSLVYRPTS
jgi:uncharacterized membrane protein